MDWENEPELPHEPKADAEYVDAEENDEELNKEAILILMFMLP